MISITFPFAVTTRKGHAQTGKDCKFLHGDGAAKATPAKQDDAAPAAGGDSEAPKPRRRRSRGPNKKQDGVAGVFRTPFALISKRVHFPSSTLKIAKKHETEDWWNKYQPVRPWRIENEPLKRKTFATKEEIAKAEKEKRDVAYDLRFVMFPNRTDEETFFLNPFTDAPFKPQVTGGILKPPKRLGRLGEGTLSSLRNFRECVDEDNRRNFIVDSGASFHLISKKDMTRSELKTIKLMKQKWILTNSKRRHNRHA